jgi:hypothetical protein
MVEAGFELADAAIVVRDIEDYNLAGGIIYGAQNVVEIPCRTVLRPARFRTLAGGRPRRGVVVRATLSRDAR